MKKKFLILTLCFTLIFSSLSYKRSYADGGIISLPILATVSALAVGTGIVLNSSDDLYDVGRIFHDYVERQNDLSWDVVNAAFFACTTLVGDRVSVGGDFLNIVKGFFDDVFSGNNDIVYHEGGLPLVPNYSPIQHGVNVFGSVHIELSSDTMVVKQYVDDAWVTIGSYANRRDFNGVAISSDGKTLFWKYGATGSGMPMGTLKVIISPVASIPYQGGYTWDNVNDRLNENDELPLPIPGNLDSLVGQGSDEFWGNTDSLVGNGSLSIPSVSNPSISVDASVDSFVGSSDSDVPDVDTGVGSPSLPSLPSWGGGLDFSPITQGVFTDKFPFCLAKDVGDIISVFDVEPKAPVFKIPLVSEELTIDLTEFELWFDIMRFFILIGFIISLIVLTRGIIG